MTLLVCIPCQRKRDAFVMCADAGNRYGRPSGLAAKRRPPGAASFISLTESLPLERARTIRSNMSSPKFAGLM